MKKRIIRLALLCLCAVMLSLVPARAWQVPSLYWNDEVWYRDTISPLIVEDGVHYIPAELCGMFDGISVEMPSEDNVLIYNRETGGYVSALIDGGKAAVNGEIVETKVFRSGGACYVAADIVCSATGLKAEYYSVPNGTVALQLSDTDVSMSLAELAAFNRTYDDEEKDALPYDSQKHDEKIIYIICDTDPGEALSVCDTLDGCGLSFTCIVNEYSTDQAIYYAASHGEICLKPYGSADGIGAAAENCASLTHRTVRAVLDSGENYDLDGQGYAAIKPDITVNGAVNAMSAVRTVIGHLGDHDRCTVYVNSSWSGCEFIRTIAGLDPDTFRCANIENIY